MKNLNRKPGFRQWKSVFLMSFILAFIATAFHGYSLADHISADLTDIKDKFTVKAAEVQDLKNSNDSLKDKLSRSATYQTPEEVKIVSRYYIKKYFADQADRVEKVMTCESGLDNRRDHTNKDGSIDNGLYQIHDEPAHRRSIAKMFPGVAFEVVTHDFDMSSKYAKWLWDRSPNNWVCNQLT